MLGMQIPFSLLALLAILPLVATEAPACNVTTTCLEIGQGNCRFGAACPAGSFCARLNQTFGQCALSARLGDKCSNVVSAAVRCYDSVNGNGIFCTDDATGNGTCVFGFIFMPGETCYPSNPDYFEDGGCLSSECGAGNKCTTLLLGEKCNTLSLRSRCAPGLYCNSISGSCAQRLPVNSVCLTSVDCDYQLICSDRGSESLTCSLPWQQGEGEGCMDDMDCEASLFCSVSSKCTAPAPFKDMYCNADSDCERGWKCACEVEFEGANRTETGGKCTEKVLNTQAYIEGFNAMQQCLKRKGCQDYWYRIIYENNYLATGPQQCFAECLELSSFKRFLFDNSPVVGQCFTTGDPATMNPTSTSTSTSLCAIAVAPLVMLLLVLSVAHYLIML